LSMPDLPPELQREIFETAVRLNRRDAALKLRLSLIAHHVHFWVDSAFYESVDIDQSRSADKFLNLVDLKPHGFFATVVKTLILCSVETVFAVRVLSVCTGVQSLALWDTWDTGLLSDWLLRLHPLSLHRLSTPCANLVNIVMDAAPLTWLESLTHLDIAFLHYPATSKLEKSLRQLPCLTHVALYEPRNSTHAQVVCTSCPVLEVLVFLRPGSDDDAQLFDDCRIVFVKYPSDPGDDWEAAHFGLPCMSWQSGNV